MGEWREARLRDICTGIFDCPHSTPALTASGPFVVRTQDIRSGTFVADEAGHVSEATYQERIARAEPSPGDILFSREGTYFGVAAEVPKGVRVCLGQRMVLIRPDQSVADARFVRYWLNSPAMVAHIRGYRDGSVAERLNLPTIRDLPIALPPLIEQRRIAGILGALDDKIELNRRTTETLEATAQTLFTSWFLDSESDPSDQRGSLADAVDLVREPVDPRREPGTVFQHYSLPAYDAGREAASERGAAIRSAKLAVPRGSILLSKLNPQIERVWLPDIRPDDRAICSTEFLVLRPRDAAGRGFVYEFLKSAPFRSTLTSLVTGTTGSHQRAHAEAILHAPLKLPAPSRAAQFERIVGPMLDRIAVARRESRTLVALRDALLPRLLSGEAPSFGRGS